MKRVFIIMVVLLFPIVGTGQAKQVNDILDKYEKKKNVESILISPALLQLAGGSNVDITTNELLSKISQLRILNIKSSAMENGVPLSKLLREDLDQLIEKEKLNRIIRVQDNDELLEMFITQSTKGVLLFIASGSKEFSVISIFGEIDKSVINAAISGEIKVK
ncbi:MAG: DUF4252 domain-containing protein [Bacteroidales bacterium]|nr:DUF4252 domain-containing protein [Bacteroidales bacterium]MDD4655995.1 DUF4252 domain-containing protein [Bacteroidales bacterium]